MDDLGRRVAALLEVAAGSDRVVRRMILTSGRRAEVVIQGAPPVVVESETNGDNSTLDSACGSCLDYATELGAVPLVVIADDADPDEDRLSRLRSLMHVLTESELRDRLTAA